MIGEIQMAAEWQKQQLASQFRVDAPDKEKKSATLIARRDRAVLRYFGLTTPERPSDRACDLTNP
jgi:hypothetical protein